MKERYIVSYTIGSSGCGFMEDKSFVGNPFKDVIDFIVALKKEFEGCYIKYSIWKGYGFDQHEMTKEEIDKEGWC